MGPSLFHLPDQELLQGGDKVGFTFVPFSCPWPGTLALKSLGPCGIQGRGATEVLLQGWAVTEVKARVRLGKRQALQQPHLESARTRHS